LHVKIQKISGIVNLDPVTIYITLIITDWIQNGDQMYDLDTTWFT